MNLFVGFRNEQTKRSDAPSNTISLDLIIC